jgi:hypothetical protein
MKNIRERKNPNILQNIHAHKAARTKRLLKIKAKITKEKDISKFRKLKALGVEYSFPGQKVHI